MRLKCKLHHLKAIEIGFPDTLEAIISTYLKGTKLKKATLATF